MCVPSHTPVDAEWYMEQEMPTRERRAGRQSATRGWKQPLSVTDIMLTDTSMQAARGTGTPARPNPLLQGRVIDYTVFGPNVLATDPLPFPSAPEDEDM